MVNWSPHPKGIFKFNVDGAARGKLDAASTDGVLHDYEGAILLGFF